MNKFFKVTLTEKALALFDADYVDGAVVAAGSEEECRQIMHDVGKYGDERKTVPDYWFNPAYTVVTLIGMADTHVPVGVVLSLATKGSFKIKGRVVFGNDLRDIEEFTEGLRELGMPIPDGHVAWVTDWKTSMENSKEPTVQWQSYEVQGIGCDSVGECLRCGQVFNYAAALHGHGCNICGICSGTNSPVQNLPDATD